MSVQATADEKIGSAQEHIRNAITDFSAVVVEECHGTEDLSCEYRRKAHKAFQVLIELRDMLKE